MKPQFQRRLPWLLAGLSIALVSVGASLSLAYVARTGSLRPLISHQGLVPFVTLAYALLGGMVASRQPRVIVGWLYLATAILYALNAVAVGYTVYRVLVPASWQPWSDILAWLNRWVWIPAQVLPLVFALLFFPDGRLPSPRWRLLAIIAGFGLAATTLSVALHPGPITSWNIPGANPFGVPAARAWLEPLLTIGSVLLALSALGAFVALGLRLRRARGIGRAQLKWVVFTGLVLLLTGGLGTVLAQSWMSRSAAYEMSIVLTEFVVVGLAVAVSIAILRYRLYDIDLVINRALVYGALTASVLALYGFVVGGLGVLLQARGSVALSLLGVGLVAIAAQPLRERLQRAVNRMMYGDRDDPYAVLSRLGQRLEATLAPEAVLPTIVETVALALKLPYAAIRLQQDGREQVVAAYGQPTAELQHWPLANQGTTVGELVLSPRAPGEAFNPADRRLLDDLARQAGVAVHAVGLTAALQRSRERLVTAREEERRRLRRDLHDGLGPQLASLTLNLETARNRLAHDPETQALLGQLAARTQAAVADIRRLVYELRPPTLDELGLVQALRQSMAQYTQPRFGQLRLALEAPDALPPLPAAVEVAVYRITLEALTNVVRHAGAHTCLVVVALDSDSGWLCVEVQDDGQGLPAVFSSGVGLISMRERAEELGGRWAIEPRQPHGTRVSVQLPCRVASGEAAAPELPVAQLSKG